MRRIVHVSDMHFGKADERVIAGLERALVRIRPHLLVVSGDLTQRASKKQFEEARRFLLAVRDTGIKLFVIPGNHDIGDYLLRPLSRMLDPHEMYRKYISRDTEPNYTDSELALVSIDTVRASTVREGWINSKQIARAAGWLSRVPSFKTRIVVTHHPLDFSPTGRPYDWPVAHARKALYTLADNKVDIYLSGHYHRSSSTETARRYRRKHYSGVAIQAGTVSKRERGEAPSFNVITIAKPRLSIETHTWDARTKEFKRTRTRSFVLRGA